MKDSTNSAVVDWLQRQSKAICWIVGPPGCGNTALARSVLPESEHVLVLSLSAASPDRCLDQVFSQQTTAGLFGALTGDTARLLLLDALDTVQYDGDESGGRVFDTRLRHLLSSAIRGRFPQLRILVTSRLRPPEDLPTERVEVIEITSERRPVPIAASFGGDGAPAVLEFLASSRKASSGWLLGLLNEPTHEQPSLVTPAAVRMVLDRAVVAGLVHRVDLGNSGEWFQMRDEARSTFLSPDRAVHLHRLVAGALESDAVSPFIQVTIPRQSRGPSFV